MADGSTALGSAKSPPASVCDTPSDGTFVAVAVKPEPACHQPSAAPLLPSVSQSTAAAAAAGVQTSPAPTLISANDASLQLEAVLRPTATATVGPLQSVKVACGAQDSPSARHAAAHGSQHFTAPNNIPSGAQPTPLRCANDDVAAAAAAAATATSGSITTPCSLQQLLPAARAHVAPSLPYAPLLISLAPPATTPMSSPAICTQPAAPLHTSLISQPAVAPAVAASHPLSASYIPTSSPSAPLFTAPPLHPHLTQQQAGSLSSPAAMEQLLLFLLNEVTDLKRTVRVMQDEREDKRRRKRERERRRQQQQQQMEDEDDTTAVAAAVDGQTEERKEAETEGDTAHMQTAGTRVDAAEEKREERRGRSEDTADMEAREKETRKKKQKRSDAAATSSGGSDGSAEVKGGDQTNKKRKRDDRGAQEEEAGEGQHEEGREDTPRERKKSKKSKNKNKSHEPAALPSTTNDGSHEVAADSVNQREERRREKRRKDKAQEADQSTASTSAAAAVDSTSTRPPAPHASSAQLAVAAPILRIGFPAAPSSSQPVVHTTAASIPSLRADAVSRSLLQPETRSPSTRSVLTSNATPPAAAPAPLTRPTAPHLPSPFPSPPPLPLPSTHSLVSVDQNGNDAINSAQCESAATQHADADMDDMPSLERVEDGEDANGTMEVVQHSPAAMERESAVIDLSDEAAPPPTPTAAAAAVAASSAALPERSPSLRPTPSSTSSAVSASSSSSPFAPPSTASPSLTASPPAGSPSSTSLPAPSLLQLEVTNKKAKLARLAAQQKLAKEKAELEAAERRQQAKEAAARWAAEEQRKREVAWLNLAMLNANKLKERDRARAGAIQHSRSKAQPAHSTPLQQQHQQQHRQRPKEVQCSGGGHGAERGSRAADHGNGVVDTNNQSNTPPPLPWFEDRRGEKD